MPRVVGASHAARMIFTGELINADEAERIGLVNQVLFVGLFVAVLWQAVRQPTRARVDTVLSSDPSPAVWAPDAHRVAVMGDFNGWNKSSHALNARGISGIWEGFVPGIGQGSLYKYHIRSRVSGYRVDKADPFSCFNEIPPKTASIVWDLDYQWNDQEWMASRRQRNALDKPMSIYEMHIGTFTPEGTFDAAIESAIGITPKEAVDLPLPWPVLTISRGLSLFDLLLSRCSLGSLVSLTPPFSSR